MLFGSRKVPKESLCGNRCWMLHAIASYSLETTMRNEDTRRHVEDMTRQSEQAIKNIERLDMKRKEETDGIRQKSSFVFILSGTKKKRRWYLIPAALPQLPLFISHQKTSCYIRGRVI